MTEELDALRDEPSPSRWLLELARIISGIRGLELEQVGGAPAYLRGLIETCPDPPYAATMFGEALDGFIHRHDLDSIATWDELAVVVDLIAAFAPPAGLGWLFRYLPRAREREIEGLRPSRIHYPSIRDLELRGFIALEGYFYSAPVSHEGQAAFRIYERILRQYLNSDYSAYALLRLVELGLVITESEEFFAAIRGRPAIVNELILLAFDRCNKSEAEGVLSALYSESLERGESAPAEFRSALAEAGARIGPNFEAGPSHERIKSAFMAIESPTGELLRLKVLLRDDESRLRHIKEQDSDEFLQPALRKYESIERDDESAWHLNGK